MKFGFIGCGNMGGAVARAVCKGAGAGDVLLANRTPGQGAGAGRRAGLRLRHQRTGGGQLCDFLFLGVKPQMMEDMLDALAPVLESRAESRPFVLVTMAAGLSMHQIRQMAGSGYPGDPDDAQHPGGAGGGHDPVLLRRRGAGTAGGVAAGHGPRRAAGRGAGEP